MSSQSTQSSVWGSLLACSYCDHALDENLHKPTSLDCGHVVCSSCLKNFEKEETQCRFDSKAMINEKTLLLPINSALLAVTGKLNSEISDMVSISIRNVVNNDAEAENHSYLLLDLLKEFALYLRDVYNEEQVNSKKMEKSESTSGKSSSYQIISRSMQKKIAALITSQVLTPDGRERLGKCIRAVGERCITELILHHQHPHQLSGNLWGAVRARGCQFLGPALQEEVIKLILLALEDGSALSRKVLVLFVVQRLSGKYAQASKTAIGHVVQLLYRASCFKVTKRENESSLMQLKPDFCTYKPLRKEHDTQIIHIANEAGLRIAPDQWSSLLYGDAFHKSVMQSIIDKIQTPQSFNQSITELMTALNRTNDPNNLSRLQHHLTLAARLTESGVLSISDALTALQAVKTCVDALIKFIQSFGYKKIDYGLVSHPKYKTSMCRDLKVNGECPREKNCTFAHNEEELHQFQRKSSQTRQSNSNNSFSRGSDGNQERTKKPVPRSNLDPNAPDYRQGKQMNTVHPLQRSYQQPLQQPVQPVQQHEQHSPQPQQITQPTQQSPVQQQPEHRMMQPQHLAPAFHYDLYHPCAAPYPQPVLQQNMAAPMYYRPAQILHPQYMPPSHSPRDYLLPNPAMMSAHSIPPPCHCYTRQPMYLHEPHCYHHGYRLTEQMHPPPPPPHQPINQSVDQSYQHQTTQEVNNYNVQQQPQLSPREKIENDCNNETALSNLKLRRDAILHQIHSAQKLPNNLKQHRTEVSIEHIEDLAASLAANICSSTHSAHDVKTSMVNSMLADSSLHTQANSGARTHTVAGWNKVSSTRTQWSRPDVKSYRVTSNDENEYPSTEYGIMSSVPYSSMNNEWVEISDDDEMSYSLSNHNSASNTLYNSLSCKNNVSDWINPNGLQPIREENTWSSAWTSTFNTSVADLEEEKDMITSSLSFSLQSLLQTSSDEVIITHPSESLEKSRTSHTGRSSWPTSSDLNEEQTRFNLSVNKKGGRKGHLRTIQAGSKHTTPVTAVTPVRRPFVSPAQAKSNFKAVATDQNEEGFKVEEMSQAGAYSITENEHLQQELKILNNKISNIEAQVAQEELSVVNDSIRRLTLQQTSRH